MDGGSADYAGAVICLPPPPPLNKKTSFTEVFLFTVWELKPRLERTWGEAEKENDPVNHFPAERLASGWQGRRSSKQINYRHGWQVIISKTAQRKKNWPPPPINKKGCLLVPFFVYPCGRSANRRSWLMHTILGMHSLSALKHAPF